jgi:hypothetical protein
MQNRNLKVSLLSCSLLSTSHPSEGFRNDIVSASRSSVCWYARNRKKMASDAWTRRRRLLKHITRRNNNNNKPLLKTNSWKNTLTQGGGRKSVGDCVRHIDCAWNLATVSANQRAKCTARKLEEIGSPLQAHQRKPIESWVHLRETTRFPLALQNVFGSQILR